MAQPIVNPELPFVSEVPSGLQPGKMLRFQGVTHPNSDRFNINLAAGPNPKPRDDTALHVSVRLNQGYIARNTYKNGSWGDEQGSGKLPIGQAQSFEIIILVDPNHYKIAVNGQHFCEFPHRIPYEEVTHFLIDGDVSITLISFEGIPLPGTETASQSSPVNAEGPQGVPQYGPPPGAYGAPPPNYGGYAPPPPPGSQPQSEFGGFFEQAQDILAGAIKSGAAEKLLGSILHSSGQPNQQPQGYAHQNARYGIYPDLPTQDTAQVPNPNSGNPQDSTLSNLIAGAGGTITSGPQPTIPQNSNNSQSAQNSPGPFQSLLAQLLSGNGNQTGASTGPEQTTSGGSDIFAGLLSSFLNNHQSQQSGNYNQPQPEGTQSSSQGQDVLAGILSSLLSSNTQNPNEMTPRQQQQQQQGQSGGGDGVANIIERLLSSYNQSQSTGSGQNNMPPQSFGQPPINSQTSGQPGTNNVEMITALLQSLMAKAKEQHDSTRPIQENNPPGGVPDPAQNPQQYGQYPHPPQEQQGPMESLLSGLLSGGGQQQQSHPPQVGGGGSVGGLGSMGGLLGSLAGSLFNKPDHNQGH